VKRGIEHLWRAVELGFDDAALLEETLELEALRSSPDFAAVVEAARARTP
jgi:hypothetical protein